MCNCHICHLLISNGAKSHVGAGVAVVTNYNHRNGSMPTKAILLGLERYGTYRNQYNICCGKKDNPCDCFVETAMRELKEEFKMDSDRNNFINRCTLRGQLRFIVQGPTPIFIYQVTGLSRSTVNEIITSHNNSPFLPHCYKEMLRVDWFTLSGCRIIPDSKNPFLTSNVNVTDFASRIANRIYSNSLF